MKLKKVLAVALSVASLAAMSATAFATDATYDASTATASLVLKDGDITGAGGQMTVAIVPKDFDGKADDIYYINQGDFATEFAAILANMGVKGEIDPANFEVRICGESMSAPAKFNFSSGGEILYGDADDNKVIDVNDASCIAQFLGGWAVDINKANADADASGVIDINDASLIAQFLGGWSVKLGPQD